jgi:hypothetical protein
MLREARFDDVPDSLFERDRSSGSPRDRSDWLTTAQACIR